MQLLALLFGFGFLLALYALLEPWIIVVTRMKAKLPMKLTIAVVGDFHVGPYKGARFVRRVVQKVNAQKPDIIFLVGDFLFDGRSSPEALCELNNLQSRYGVFGVLGNHENPHVLRHRREDRLHVTDTPLVQTLREAGVQTLHNEHTVLTLTTGKTLAIVGVDDLWSGLDDLTKAYKDVPADMPSILLCHNPDVILDPESRQADLILSGHTHAGQLRLPLIGALSPIPQQLGRRYTYGRYVISPTTELVITRGVGESGLPIRFYAPPEVMMLET